MGNVRGISVGSGIGCVQGTIKILFYQNFHILMVYIVDILDQLIISSFVRCLNQAYQIAFRITDLAGCKERATALDLAIVCLCAKDVTVPNSVTFLMKQYKSPSRAGGS